METKITPARLALYAQRVARRVGETAFTHKTTLDGPALQTLTGVRSLNLLVLHGLFGQWQAEARQLRSPYFNYEAPDVQLALKGLLNTLSRHIRVERPTLEKLVEQAVIDGMGLTTDPAATYERRFLPGEGSVSASELRADLKFVTVNKELFTGFLDSLPPAALDRPTLASRLALYVRAHYKEATPPTALLAELSQLVPVTLAELQENMAAAAAAVPPVARPVVASPAPAAKPQVAPPVMPPPKPAPTTAPVAVAPPAPPAAPAPKPTPVAVVPAVVPPVTAPAAPPAAGPVAPPVVPVAKPAAPNRFTEGITPATPLHEKLRAERVTLNDQLRHREQPGLAEVLETKAKVESLEKAITINQRYTLISELFDGDREAYTAAIKQLDALTTLEQARTYVTGGQMSAGHNWAEKDDHVQRLMKLVERKFA